MPYSEAEARVAKSSYFLAWGAPGASMNLSEIKLVIRKYGALSLAFRFPSIPCHYPNGFRGPSLDQWVH